MYMPSCGLLFVETICIAVIMQMLTACNSYSFVGLLWAIVKLNKLIGACASHKIFHSCMQHCSNNEIEFQKFSKLAYKGCYAAARPHFFPSNGSKSICFVIDPNQSVLKESIHTAPPMLKTPPSGGFAQNGLTKLLAKNLYLWMEMNSTF